MAKVLQEQDGLMDFDILINNTKLKETVEVMEIFVQKEMNKISFATVEILDGGVIGVVNDPFTNSEGKDFVPGNEIEIKVGYDGKRSTVFKGIIISQRLSVKQYGSRLIITCKDKAVQMTNGRFNAIFQEEKDSSALKKVIQKYGLSLKIDDTTATQTQLLQYNCTDWDFLVLRAELNNAMVLTNNNDISLKKIDFSASPVCEINTSQSAKSINLGLDGEKISDSYVLTSWNDKEQKQNEVSVNLSDGISQGNLSAKKITGIGNKGSTNCYSATSLSNEELKSWGTSLATKAVLSKIQGNLVVQGTSEINAGDMIDISGFSKRFNGKAFVSKVIHEVKEGVWLTDIYVGKSPAWQAALPDIVDTSASGLIPAAPGIQIGKVKKIDEDPDGNFRVQITLPTFPGNGQEEGIWARMAFPYASAEAGFFFFPEVDDEVLVHFINNDPRFPVITGSLYSTKNKPKEVPDAKNQFKAIHSKSGINIRFDDEEKILVFETPDGNTCTLDDKEKSITLKDISGNTITLNEEGIAVDSAKDMMLSAKGDVQISASGSIDLKANGDVKGDGTNIQFNAKSGFAGKGNASAEISASGQTTVKGAMVMIN